MKRRRSKRTSSSLKDSTRRDTSVSPRTGSGKPRQNDSACLSSRGTSQCSSADVSVTSSQIEILAAERRREKMMKQLEAMKAHFEATQRGLNNKPLVEETEKVDDQQVAPCVDSSTAPLETEVVEDKQNVQSVSIPEPIETSDCTPIQLETNVTQSQEKDTFASVSIAEKPIDSVVTGQSQMDTNTNLQQNDNEYTTPSLIDSKVVPKNQNDAVGQIDSNTNVTSETQVIKTSLTAPLQDNTNDTMPTKTDTSDIKPPKDDTIVSDPTEPEQLDIKSIKQTHGAVSFTISLGDDSSVRVPKARPKRFNTKVSKPGHNESVVTNKSDPTQINTDVIKSTNGNSVGATKNEREVFDSKQTSTVVTRPTQNDSEIAANNKADIPEPTKIFNDVNKPTQNDNVVATKNEVATNPSKPKRKLNQKDFPFPVKGVMHRRHKPADILLVNSASENIVCQAPDPLEIEKVKKVFDEYRKQIKQDKKHEAFRQMEESLFVKHSEQDDGDKEINVYNQIGEDVKLDSDRDKAEARHIEELECIINCVIDRTLDKVFDSMCLDIEDVVVEEEMAKSVVCLPKCDIAPETVVSDTKFVNEEVSKFDIPEVAIITGIVDDKHNYTKDKYISNSAQHKSLVDIEAVRQSVNVDAIMIKSADPKIKSDTEIVGDLDKINEVINKTDEPNNDFHTDRIIKEEKTGKSDISKRDITNSITVSDHELVGEKFKYDVPKGDIVAEKPNKVPKKVIDTKTVEELQTEEKMSNSDVFNDGNVSICDDKMATCCVTNFLSVLNWSSLPGNVQSSTFSVPKTKLGDTALRDGESLDIPNGSSVKCFEDQMVMQTNEECNNRRKALKPTRRKLKKERKLEVLKYEFENAQNKERRRKNVTAKNQEDDSEIDFVLDPTKVLIDDGDDDDDDDDKSDDQKSTLRTTKTYIGRLNKRVSGNGIKLDIEPTNGNEIKTTLNKDSSTGNTQYNSDGCKIGMDSTSADTEKPKINPKTGRRITKRPVGQRYANIKTKVYTGKGTAPSGCSTNMKSNGIVNLPSVHNQNNTRQHNIITRRKSSRPVGDRYKNIKTKICTGRAGPARQREAINDNRYMPNRLRNCQRNDMAYRNSRENKCARSRIDTGLRKQPRKEEFYEDEFDEFESRSHVDDEYTPRSLGERNDMAYRNSRDIKYVTPRINTGLRRPPRKRDEFDDSEFDDGDFDDDEYTPRLMRERNNMAYNSGRGVNNKFVRSKIDTGLRKQAREREEFDEFDEFETRRNVGPRYAHQPMRGKNGVAYRNERDINNKYATPRIDTGLNIRRRNREADEKYDNECEIRGSYREKNMHQPMRERNNVAYINDRDINCKYAASKIDTGLRRHVSRREAFENELESRSKHEDRYLHQPMRERNDIAYINDRDINNRYATSKIDYGLRRHVSRREAFENEHESRRNHEEGYMHQPMRERNDVAYRDERDINNKYATSKIETGLNTRGRNREANDRYENDYEIRDSYRERNMHQPMQERKDVAYRNDRDINNKYASSRMDDEIGRLPKRTECFERNRNKFDLVRQDQEMNTYRPIRERNGLAYKNEGENNNKYASTNMDTMRRRQENFREGRNRFGFKLDSRGGAGSRNVHQPMRERNEVAYRNNRDIYDKYATSNIDTERDRQMDRKENIERCDTGFGSRLNADGRDSRQPMRERNDLPRKKPEPYYGLGKHVSEMVLAELVRKMNMKEEECERVIEDEEEERQIQLMLEEYNQNWKNGGTFSLEEDIEDDVDKSARENDSKYIVDDQQRKDTMFVPSPPPGQPSSFQTRRSSNNNIQPSREGKQLNDKDGYIERMIKYVKEAEDAKKKENANENETEEKIKDNDNGASKNVKLNESESAKKEQNNKSGYMERMIRFVKGKEDANKKGKINGNETEKNVKDKNIKAKENETMKNVKLNEYWSVKCEAKKNAKNASLEAGKSAKVNDFKISGLRNDGIKEVDIANKVNEELIEDIQPPDELWQVFSPSPPQSVKPTTNLTRRRQMLRPGFMSNGSTKPECAKQTDRFGSGRKAMPIDELKCDKLKNVNEEKSNNLISEVKRNEALFISFSPRPPVGEKPQTLPRKRRPPSKSGGTVNGHDSLEQNSDNRGIKDVSNSEVNWVTSPTPPSKDKPLNHRNRRPLPKPGCMVNTTPRFNNTDQARPSKTDNRGSLTDDTSNRDIKKKGEALWFSFSPTPPNSPSPGGNNIAITLPGAKNSGRRA